MTLAEQFANMIVLTNNDPELRNDGVTAFEGTLINSVKTDDGETLLLAFSDTSTLLSLGLELLTATSPEEFFAMMAWLRDENTDTYQQLVLRMQAEMGT